MKRRQTYGMIRSDTGATVPVRHKLTHDTLNQAHDKIARLEISVNHWREQWRASEAKVESLRRELEALRGVRLE